MNLANAEIMVSAKIKGDTGDYGLWASTTGRLINAVGFDVMPPGSQVPYVLASIVAGDEDDTFPDDAVLVDFEFEVTTNKTSETQARESAILNRLRVLFHRATPVVTGCSNTEMFRVTGTTAHTAEQRVYIERYRLRLE